MRNANEYDNTPLFKTVTPEEEPEYRRWARDNWKPGDAINPVWHPIVRDEIGAIEEELAARTIAAEAVDETEQENEERGAGRVWN